MEILADYHTHTIFSDGFGTIEENVISAIEKGLKVIAITDHGSGYVENGIDKNDYKKMREIVDRLNEKYFGIIHILLGIEANVMELDGSLDVDDEILKYNDILLAGFHFDIVYKGFLLDIRKEMNRWQPLKSKLEENLYEEIVEINTEALIKAMKKYDIDIITHPNYKQPINITKIAKVAEETNTALEINNFHRHLNGSEIKEAMKFKNLRFVINSDAHRPRDVGNFLGAVKVLNKAGIKSLKTINFGI